MINYKKRTMPEQQITRYTPSIHPAYARLLCAHMKQEGIAPELLFEGNSLNWNDLVKRQRSISFAQFQALAQQAIELSDCPWLGLRISSIIQASSHGPLGYGALAASTVRGAFELIERMMPTRLSLYGFSLEDDSDYAYFNVHAFLDLGGLTEFVQVMLLGSLLDILEKTSGQSCDELIVSFPFQRPDWHERYRERFGGIEFVFGAEQFTVRMPKLLLDEPCLTADEFAFRNALLECETLLKRFQGGGELSDQITKLLLEQGAPYPGLEEMAEHFHCAPRTLIRRLKAEGTQYQAVIDELRKEKASWMLMNGKESIEEIASLLGFQDTSNFSRVFRRWYGRTPSAFRSASKAMGSAGQI